MIRLYGALPNSNGLPTRSLEWFSACIMLSWAVTLFLPGESLSAPQFVAFARFGMSENLWAAAFLAIGGARVIALYVNGQWPKTPYIRMFGALFGAVTWAQVAYLITAGAAPGVPATGTGVYVLLALADLLSIFRASFDARYYNQ